MPCVNGCARATKGSPDARPVNAGIGPARLERYGEEILAQLDSVRG